MKTMFVKTILATVCLFFALQLSAQAPTAKKYDNPKWRSVVYIDYHAGKAGRALEIIYEHFKKASDKAGTQTPISQLEMKTGEYDLILVWEMQGGIEDMNWEISPNNIKWREALNEQMGGKEKADELMTEYLSLIRSVKSELAMEQRGQ